MLKPIIYDEINKTHDLDKKYKECSRYFISELKKIVLEWLEC